MTTNKDPQLLALRPEIKTQPSEILAEQFQNGTLRPILKLQNNLLIRILRQYVKNHKLNFEKLSLLEKEKYIGDAVRKDNALRHLIRGIVIGHFTNSEWAAFENHADELNKRLINLAEQRLISQIGEI